ncbi:MAG: UDP-N-acetylmuramoyl-L-alanyl-D-glutamate--2,6-diaminopimelate ligase [Chlamydiae bacterium]|nr:UDP-N-acetylmuramoyl-L-alanyl-D-glutamate--2,6-diaminopimelate ligase [Chlamydiota bacterium]MBI3267014.1 UDP-N-acetylmuramoyl-L-alanyl-D-glutamate--2,6-diaminopimelate ligase [Chlamydiota bacterium]
MHISLSSLIKGLEILSFHGDPHVLISGISFDSRKVEPGHLFIAWRGEKRDGKDFAEDAVSRGAVALCVEDENIRFKNVSCFVVKDARRAMAQLACAFYENPAEGLTVVGVTGTNGKTTVSFLIESLLRGRGDHPGLLGTVYYKMGRRLIPAERTTPESLDLQKYFRDMLDQGSQSVVLEASSHALGQGRLDGISFDVAVFTNLSQDHLDYHQNLENYFSAKAILFRDLLSPEGFAVVNHDDPWGARVEALSKARLISYGLSQGAMIQARHLESDMGGSSFEVVFPNGSLSLRLPLIGRFNVYNALAAFAVGWVLGMYPEKIKEGLENFKNVPGRMEFVSLDAPFQVIVDYAHTEEALRNVLETLRPLVKGRLITLFGCGGDRDRSKRPKMGCSAAHFSDFVIITSDNPRSEDPEKIICEIEAGVAEEKIPFEKISDRRTAIDRALDLARRGDVVLVAGKGHEKFQQIGAFQIPFDDVAVVKESVQRVAYSLQE